MNPAELASELKRLALESGADLAGIAPAAPAREAGAYDKWVSSGMNATMDYMARNAPSRHDIRAWFPPSRSVLMCGFSYGNDSAAGETMPGSGRLARYAVREDYHPLLKDRMASLLDWVRSVVPNANGLPFCDTSPLLERSYALSAGLGWQGKSAMMIAPRLGTYFLLAGLALDLELPADSSAPDHCGSCRLCLDGCPTDAFAAPRVLNAAKCIAYLTIENRGPVPEALRPGVGDRVFGCDVCQEVCPWNRFEKPGRFLPGPREALAVPLEELAELDAAAFKRRFRDLPVSRAKRRGLIRSVLLAMGNSGLSRFRAVLQAFTSDPDEMISEQARWSLARLPA
ncbi:MAG: tRNA epoxyqueuosine(34) reductase QueG [Elusimicrobia bacterium RBG_16_66_12]|nr:MAG: tRNA epoxyqueuosine(34) reductase QueG [Elusimicrobia bacterium RBG_16_66_12]